MPTVSWETPAPGTESHAATCEIVYPVVRQMLAELYDWLGHAEQLAERHQNVLACVRQRVQHIEDMVALMESY